jgi:2-oxoglutarate ferredoxin oxidoreductase subunit alpha
VGALLKLPGGGERLAAFLQVWPRFRSPFEGQGIIASNEFHRAVRLLRRETGQGIEKTILRYDGLPLTPEYILREMEQRGW